MNSCVTATRVIARRGEGKMKLELTVPALAVYDAVVSGLEGGIQYWARVTSVWAPARAAGTGDFETDLKLVCDLVELDTGERIKLREQWATGLRLMAEKYPRRFAEVVDGTGDATTGDVLIQLAAFGELRYG